MQPLCFGPLFGQWIGHNDLTTNAFGNDFRTSSGKLRLHEDDVNIVLIGVSY